MATLPRFPEVGRALRGSAALVPAGVAIGLGNLAFGAVVGRIVGSATYGAIGTLLVAGTIAALASQGTQYEVAHGFSSPRVDRRLTKRQLYELIRPWLIPAGVFAACAVPLDRFLHLSSPWPVVLAAVLFVGTVLSTLPQGVLVGSQKFGAIAVIGVAAAVARIALGEWLPRQIPQVTGALLASVLAVMVGGIAYLMAARSSLRQRHRHLDESTPGPTPSTSSSPRVALINGTLAVLLWLSLSVPLLVARHVLAPATVGAFAVTQALASGLIFAVGPIATAFFPTITRDRSLRSAAAGSRPRW